MRAAIIIQLFESIFRLFKRPGNKYYKVFFMQQGFEHENFTILEVPGKMNPLDVLQEATKSINSGEDGEMYSDMIQQAFGDYDITFIVTNIERIL